MAKLELPKASFEAELVAGTASKALKLAGAEAGKLYNIDPANIRRIPDFNVRVHTASYEEHIVALQHSITTEGFFGDKPLSGYVGKDGEDDVIWLTDGYTRLTAVERAIAAGVEIPAVPVIIKPAGTSIEDLTVALIQGNEGRPLTVLERAAVASRLVKFGKSASEVAERLKVTDRYVGDLLLLAAAPPKVRQMVANDKVSSTEAVRQLRKNPTEATKLLEAAVKTAEQRGKAKASAKDTKGAAPPKEEKDGVSAKVTTRDEKKVTTIVFSWKQGAVVPTDEIKPVRLMEGGEWWNYVDANTKEHVIIEETIKITVTIEQIVEDDTFATDEKKPAAEGAAVAELEDKTEVGEEEGGAPPAADDTADL